MTKQKILVVEDDARIASVMQTIFKLNQIDADIVNSGEDAIDILKQEQYRLIISDIMLPGLDGFDVLKEAKSDPKTRDVPFLFLSAFADDADVLKGLQAGADDYITKPFTAKGLVSIIKQYLDQ